MGYEFQEGNVFNESRMAAKLAACNAETYLGCVLQLMGACPESVEWVDLQEHDDLYTLMEACKEEEEKWLWLEWLNLKYHIQSPGDLADRWELIARANGWL